MEDVQVTGNVGPVMMESARVGATLARSFVEVHQPTNTFFKKHSLHLHLPDISVYKVRDEDGSAARGQQGGLPQAEEGGRGRSQGPKPHPHHNTFTSSQVLFVQTYEQV